MCTMNFDHTAAATSDRLRRCCFTLVQVVVYFSSSFPLLTCRSSHPALRLACEMVDYERHAVPPLSSGLAAWHSYTHDGDSDALLSSVREKWSSTRARGRAARTRHVCDNPQHLHLLLTRSPITGEWLHVLLGSLRSIRDGLCYYQWWLDRPAPFNGWSRRPLIQSSQLRIDLIVEHEDGKAGSLKVLRHVLRDVHRSPFFGTSLRYIDFQPLFQTLDVECCLWLQYCQGLECLHLHIGSIAVGEVFRTLGSLRVLALDAYGTQAITAVLSELHPPQQLLVGCRHLKELQVFTNAPALKAVDISNSVKLQKLDDIRGLPLLRLYLPHCQHVEDWTPLGGLHSLQELDVSRNMIDNIDWLSDAMPLRNLLLRGCRAVEDAGPLRYVCATLEVLDLSGTGVADLGPLASCLHLRFVSVRGCWRVSTIDSLCCLPYLQELDVSMTDIPSVEPLVQCPRLTRVDVDKCRFLRSLSPLGELEALEEISAAHSFVGDIDGLSSSTSLTWINLTGCHHIRSTLPLQAIPSLQAIIS